LTAPLFGLIRALLAHKKTGGQSEQALGRSRGGFSTKIMISTDGLGYPLRLSLIAGQVHDSTQAVAMIDGLTCQYVIADRAFAGQTFIAFVIDTGAEPVIPPHQNSKQPRPYDTWLYRERHLVECFINKIKHFRRVFSRFDKLASRYLSFLHFVSMLIWLR
jgi:transposase